VNAGLARPEGNAIAAFPSRLLPVHTWPMFQGVTAWIARAAGLVFVGALTFTHPPTVAGGTTTQLIAFIGLLIGEAFWALGEVNRLPERSRGYLWPGAGMLMVATACLGATAAGGGTFLIAIATVALMGVTAELGLAIGLATGALGVLVTEIGGIAFHESVGTFIGFPLLLIVGLLFGRSRADYRIRAEQAAALLEQQERLQAEQRRADVLDERTRLAREIHDVLAHSLGALGIQIQMARALITDRNDTEAALEALSAAQRMASEGLIETRRAVHALRTDTLPLHEELARAAAEHAERQHVLVHCDIEGEPRPVPPDATVALLRATQESLVNAAKHAPGAEVELYLLYRADGVRLAIANDLADKLAEDAAQPAGPRLQTIDGGYGLTGMRERLKLLRGTLEAGPVGNRWIVTAELPLTQA
jgi:signal transduction histidine kinase